jgi:hypothetical protein
VAAGEQSPNWDRSYAISSPDIGRGEWIQQGVGEPLPKPKDGPDGEPQVYDLISRRGQRLMGTPLFAADSPHDPTAHDEWKLVEGERAGERYAVYAVVAWKIHQDSPASSDPKPYPTLQPFRPGGGPHLVF